MKYTHETLHKLLLRMQSLDYPGYKDATELDMLAHVSRLIYLNVNL